MNPFDDDIDPMSEEFLRKLFESFMTKFGNGNVRIFAGDTLFDNNFTEEKQLGKLPHMEVVPTDDGSTELVVDLQGANEDDIVCKLVGKNGTQSLIISTVDSLDEKYYADVKLGYDSFIISEQTFRNGVLDIVLKRK